MSTQLKLVPGDLGEGYCPDSYQQLYSDMMALGYALQESGGLLVISATEPGVSDRDKLWVKLNGAGAISNFYVWVLGPHVPHWEPWSKPRMHCVESYSGGTAPTAPTAGVWTPRILNTVSSNSIVGASLGASNGQITLPDGTFKFTASAPAALCAGHAVQLYKTDNGQIIYGSSEYAPSSCTRSFVSGILTGPGVYELRHRVESLDGSHPEWTFGRPVTFLPATEQYAQIIIDAI